MALNEALGQHLEHLTERRVRFDAVTAHAVQANLATLAARGIELVGPGIGKLACGDVAKGTLSPVDEIVEPICKKLGV